MAGDTPSPDEKVQTSIYLTREQKEWLDEHPEFNLSGWVRGLLEFPMDSDEPERTREMYRLLELRHDVPRTSAGDGDGA